ncbi:MAG: hypothetical protein LBT21_04125 [Oscillospiraceae bacterium]|jgi:hypothetical protein|nr:hypothetical protein [Oscillospiraceae bacterium]
MDFHMKLPRRKREFALFMAVISIISVNIIAPLITCFEVGFHLSVWADVLTIIPFVWLSVIALVLLTYKPAEWLTRRVVKHGDSFRSTVTVNILCSVFLLSIFLTVVGTWIGTKQISLEPITGFFYKWPRNFAVSLGVELLIAQPIARLVMHKYHQHIDAKAQAEDQID